LRAWLRPLQSARRAAVPGSGGHPEASGRGPVGAGEGSARPARATGPPGPARLRFARAARAAASGADRLGEAGEELPPRLSIPCRRARATRARRVRWRLDASASLTPFRTNVVGTFIGNDG